MVWLQRRLQKHTKIHQDATNAPNSRAVSRDPSGLFQTCFTRVWTNMSHCFCAVSGHSKGSVWQRAWISCGRGAVVRESRSFRRATKRCTRSCVAATALEALEAANTAATPKVTNGHKLSVSFNISECWRPNFQGLRWLKHWTYLGKLDHVRAHIIRTWGHDWPLVGKVELAKAWCRRCKHANHLHYLKACINRCRGEEFRSSCEETLSSRCSDGIWKQSKSKLTSTCI